MGHDCGRGADTRDFSREVMGVKKFAHTGTSPEIETHRHYIVADGRKARADHQRKHINAAFAAGCPCYLSNHTHIHNYVYAATSSLCIGIQTIENYQIPRKLLSRKL
jgi:hypothetical protein